MHSVAAFNQVVKEFAQELKETFSDFEDIEKSATAIMLVPDDDDILVQPFMEAVKPYMDQINNKDVEALSKIKIDYKAPVVGQVKISFQELLQSGVSDTTVDAIFSYISTLQFIGTALTMIPCDVMSSIESMSENIGNNLKNGDIDARDIMPNIMNQLPGLINMMKDSVKQIEQ